MFESILTRLLTWIGDNLPEEQSCWYQAIIAEGAQIQNTRDRLQWLLGGVFVAVRARTTLLVREITLDAEGQRLPAEVILVAAYQCLFSLVLLGLVVFQLPRIREPWSDALPVLSMAFVILSIPGVLGLGLLVLDNAARWGTMVFSLCHALLAWHRISASPVHPMFPALRIAFDAFIIAALLRPEVVRRFMAHPFQLKLR